MTNYNIIDRNNIETIFDNISRTYDFLNHLLSFNIDKKWRKKTVKQINNNKSKILDLATGTGDLACEIIKQHKANKVYAIDISTNLLSICNKKITKKHWENKIILSNQNAVNLNFDSNYFDAITISFGIRNFYDLDRSLKEIYRVLNLDGQLLILEFSCPTNLFIRKIYIFYLNHIIPCIGKYVSKDKNAYKYLAMSINKFNKINLVSKLSKTGFRTINCKKLSFGICTIYNAKK